MAYPAQHSSTALQLKLTAATIIQCSFINLTGTVQQFLIKGPGVPVEMRAGGAIISVQSNLTISRSTFQGNSATVGGAIFAWIKCNISILNTTFADNQAVCHDELCRNKRLAVPRGGALAVQTCNLLIQSTIFNSNHTNGLGGAMHTIQSNIRAIATIFFNNSAVTVMNESITNSGSGGVLSALISTINFTKSTFTFNRANYGGAMYTQTSIITLINNTFTDNNAKFDGGVLRSFTDYNVHVIRCQFINNSATDGGSISADKSNINSTQNVFSHNYAKKDAIMIALVSNVTTCEDFFIFNIGGLGVMAAYFGTFTIHSTFIGYNRARNGTVFDMFHVAFYSHGIVNIINNEANKGVINYDLCQADLFSRTLFNNNTGLIVIFNSNITFNGTTYISNCNASSDSVLLIQLSTVVFYGISIIVNNQAMQGGAIYITDSRVFLHGETTISNNTAMFDGGGIFLHKSELHCKEYSTLIIYGNRATTNGGGISALSSSIFATDTFKAPLLQNETFFTQGSSMIVFKNQAKLGGGISLWNSNLFISAYSLSSFSGNNLVINFTENVATNYGGAIYVDDYSSNYVCSSTRTNYFSSSLCFLQIFFFKKIDLKYNRHTYIHFSQNYAAIAGSTIFGGLFDRCLMQNGTTSADLQGTSFLRSVTNIDSLDSITSYPVKVCFCREHKSDCSYEHPPIYVMKGYPFALSVVAIDQVNHTVKFSTIASYLDLGKGRLSIDQQMQNTKESCTDLTYNVFSPNTSIELALFAKGPCGAALPSVRRVKILFIPCSCPIGFQPTHADKTKCECGCDPELLYDINKCDPNQESIVREGNFWIAYVNSSDNSSSGYIGYQHCPLDYCLPATSKINISLSIPNGSDMQCGFNRSRLLCGRCKPHYSISLGSSHCIQCSSNQLKWVIPLMIVAALMGGIILVIILLILNLTVARGTLNGIIFYANIAFTNKSSFLPFTRPNFISVVISWLNLEIGMDTCFYSGMDMYWKTWIQLGFSAYLFFLVTMIIVISERSTILSNIIRRKNPVATLATLVLLSYTKLLHIIISALSSAIIKYPDGSKTVVWLADATLEYWSGKHIALFFVAIVLLIIGMFYTVVLLFWQWLLPRQDWKLLHWIKNQKLCMFIETYHAPYNFKHRYWTGLLLLVRIILLVVAAMNVSGDLAMNLVANCVLIVTLMVFKLYVQGTTPVYKTWLIDILESACLVNVLTFSFFKLYYLAENSSQVIIAYLSGIIIIVMFASVLVYHICTELLFKTKIWMIIDSCIQTRMRRNRDEREMVNLLDHQSATTDEEDEAIEPTFTIIERPTPQQPLSELVEDTKTE